MYKLRLVPVHDERRERSNTNCTGLMMSGFNGHDRPFPTWFPYLFIAILMIGATAYFTLSGGKATPSSQIREDMSVARYKHGAATNRRSLARLGPAAGPSRLLSREITVDEGSVPAGGQRQLAADWIEKPRSHRQAILHVARQQLLVARQDGLCGLSSAGFAPVLS